MQVQNTIVLFLLNCFCYSTSSSDIITIKQGALQGTILKSRGGKDFNAYLGIPYAKPPIGNLRFKSPESHPEWNGIRNATEEGEMCVQSLTLFPAFSGLKLGSEDCLFINVFRPKAAKTKKLPVMVFIYGGAFQMGDSGTKTYGPHYLMDKDIIYVNFNYRLGALGFLSFGNNEVSGNFGLKDQLLALKWIKDNIEYFGGDPESITLFGESAGAASVHYHTLSPKSQGLFHKGILQSGSSFCPWALVQPNIAKARAEAFATLLSCYGDMNEIVKCLRRISAYKILDAQLKFIEWGIHPLATFVPVIEINHNDAFITKHTYHYSSNPSLPLIIGFNQDEGAIITARMCSNNMKELHELNDNWERLLPLSLILNENVNQEDSVKIVQGVTEYYLKSNKVNADNIRNLSNIYGDVAINFGVMEVAQHHKGPIYFYLYNYVNQVSWISAFGSCSTDLGVSHADELTNLFNLESLFQNLNLEGHNLEMSRTFLDLWTSFAETGVPVSKSIHLQWDQYNPQSMNYLYFDNDVIEMREAPFFERMEFMKTLPFHFKKFSQVNANERTEL